jgi:hypothetical protein
MSPRFGESPAARSRVKPFPWPSPWPWPLLSSGQSRSLRNGGVGGGSASFRRSQPALGLPTQPISVTPTTVLEDEGSIVVVFAKNRFAHPHLMRRTRRRWPRGS